MATLEKPRVFIGSSSRNIDLAKAVQRELDKVNPVVWKQGEFKVGKTTFETLGDVANTNDFAIFVVSPGDPGWNVIFELGMFIGRNGTERAFVLCAGEDRLKLERKLSDMKGVTLAMYSKEELKKYRANTLGRSLQAVVGIACGQISEQIQQQWRIDSRYFLKRSGGTSVSESLLTSQVSASKFGFFDLAALAEREIFAVAQNNHWLLVDHFNETRRMVLDFLKKDRARSIRFLMMDPGDESAVTSWARAINTEPEMFRGDLERSCLQLAKLSAEARQLGLDLEAHLGRLVTMSITFVDVRSSQNGFAVFVPNVVQNNPGTRPAYFLGEAEHADIVSGYYAAYDAAFSRARPVESWRPTRA